MPCHHGLVIILPDTKAALKAPLNSINVKTTTCGPIAQNTIKFKYKNENASAINSKFIFPVNSASAIYHLSANVGGRKIIGKVKEKSEAKKEFDQAVSDGKSAVMAKESKEAGDIIELELGAFGENEQAEIVVKEVFEMKLVKKGKFFQYKFPTSLFVRYGKNEDGGNVTADVSRVGATDYCLNFELESLGVSEIKPKPWLGSLTKGSLFSFNGNKKVFEKDHDVILELKLKEGYKGFRMVENWKDLNVIENQSTDQNLLLSSILAKIDSVPISELPAKEYVFVVDCSGSMHGQRIADARNTLQQLINSLPVGSKFNVVRFGSRFEKLFRDPKDYNQKNKELAINLAKTMDADLGGTEMYECLKSILEGKRTIDNFKRQIFVLTDGGISNQDQTLKLVSKHSKTNRIFSFGIGSGCSTALVNGLAEQGKGSASFISDKSSGNFVWEKEEGLSEICVKSIMASASQHISKIEIKPEVGLKAPSKDINMVTDSSFLNVFHDIGKIESSENLDLSVLENLEVQPKLCITRANENEEHEIINEVVDVPVIKSPFESNVLHKLAGKKIISKLVSDLKNQNDWETDKEKIRKEIIEVSVKEQVLSPLTALVGIADEATVTGVSQRVDVGCLESGFGRDMFSYGSTQMASFGGGSRSRKMKSRMLRCSAPMRAMSGSIANSSSAPMFKSAPCMAPPPPPVACMAPPPPPVAIDCMALPPPPVVCMAECDMEFDLFDSVKSEKKKIVLKESKPKPVKPENNTPVTLNNYQAITNAQHPSGYWSDVTSFNAKFGIKELISKKFSDDKIIGTIYALILLFSRFESQYNEWKLTAIKGVGILKQEFGDENAIDEFQKIASEAGCDFDDELVEELFE